jgi:hypothetical protein
VARGEREEGKGGPAGSAAWRRREQGGTGTVVSSVGAVALPCEQGRGRAWAMRCGRLTRGPKQDGGPGVSSGVQERAGKRGRAATGH